MGFVKKTAFIASGVFVALAIGWLGLRSASADSLTFSGTVQLPSGTVYTEGGGVNLYSNANGYWGAIESNGTFSISGIAAGTYTLDVGVSQSSSYANPAQQQLTLTSSLSGFIITVETPAIRGTLALPDGTATSGCVDVHDPTWTIRRGSCAGSDGIFKLGALDAGTYILSVSTPDNSPYVGIEQTVTITDSSTTLELGTVRFENPFVVGKVAFPDGTLIPWNDDWNLRTHLSVDLWNNDNTVNRHSNYDSDSKFKFGRMPAGTYTIHVNVWDTELYTGSANQTITVTESGLDMTATPIRLTTPQLSGVVYKPDGVTPVQNAWVNLHPEDWSANQGSSTDANGKYRIGGLDAGTYNLEVNPPHDQTDMVRYEESGITITSSLTTKNITLTAARKFMKGTVKKDGRGISCANVNANRRGGQGWAGTTTASDGSFTLILSPGSWNVRVEPSSNWECPAADWIFTDPEAMVDFSDNNTEQTETVNFTVQKSTAKIIGTVKTKSGAKITNGNINANSQTPDGRNRWSNAQIKADGTYTLNLMPGTYDLNVWTQDNRLFTRNQKVTVSKDETKTVNFTMNEKLAHIIGNVTDKSGKALAGIYLNGNLDCGPEGCSAWSNTQTASDGTYDMAVTAGRWNLNFDSGRGAAYVYDGPMNDVYVETETSTVSGVNFSLTYADVTIKGKVVDETGAAFSDFQGWAYVRPTTVTEGNGYREYGGGVNQGVFNFRAPSTLFSIAEIGVHMPPNSRYSSVPGATVTLTADATIEKDIVVKQNDAAIAGRFIDSSGLPLGKCDFRGEVYANAQDNQWHGTQVNPDCTYEISLLAGTYNLGYHVDASSGLLNRPTNIQVTVASGSRAQQDLKVVTGDARIVVFVVNPDGTPARRAWVWAGNHREIDEERRSAEKQSKEGEDFVGPGGTKSPEELFDFCSKPENEKECADFKLPPGAEGPGGCTTALECTKYCQKNKKQCEEAVKKDGKVVTASTVPVSLSAKTRKARIAGLQSVTANAEKDEDDPFANVIETGSETNDKGVATLSLISGHRYMVNAGVAPETGLMPPKEVEVNLMDKKSANVTLALRQSDGKMTGFVLWNDVAVRNGWVGCWSEDGGNTGSPIINGTYSMNYTFNSVYHCNANAFDGTTFLNSDEKIVVIETKKKTTTNFTVGEARFQLPPAISESFDATSTHVITLADGTTFNIPANALASSGTVTVNVSPTVNVQSQKTAQPIAYAYNAQAFDSDNKEIVTFNDDITMCFKYSDEMLADSGIEEDALISSYWDTSSGSWKQPENTTQDKDNNTICVSANHFTSYAVVNKSGKGKGQNLTTVTTEKTKKGKTKITIGTGKSKKSVIPFPSYTGDVSVTTFRASKKAGQIIVATPAERTKTATAYKIYSVKGKLSQTAKPWGAGYTDGARLDSEDLTKNGYDDLIIAPSNGGQVKIIDMKKQKSYSVKAPRSGAIVAEALNLKGRGTNQLAITAGKTIEAWDFVNGTFKKFDFDQRRLRATATSIERVTLQPMIQSVTPNKITVKKSGTVKITITGENFGKGSRVYLNQTIPAKKVEVMGETKLVATFNLALLRKNKNYDVVVVNGDGEQASMAGLKTKK